MNEKIRELAEQANGPNPFYGTLKNQMTLLGDDAVEKFAELIVRECVRCCEQVINDPVPESVDTWLNGGSQCIQEIKQHFGVKE